MMLSKAGQCVLRTFAETIMAANSCPVFVHIET